VISKEYYNIDIRKKRVKEDSIKSRTEKITQVISVERLINFFI
jgi:hypothetical protein